MTKRDDAPHILSAAAEATAIRRHCIEGTERYKEALIKAGYLPAPRRAA